MIKTTFSVLLFVFLFAGCSMEDEPESSKTSRQQNMQRYLQKAKEQNDIAAERKVALPAVAPVNPATVLNLTPQQVMLSLPQELRQAKTQLEQTVRDQYGQLAAEQAGAIILQFHQEALRTVKEAKSPDEVNTKITALDAKYRQKIQNFLRVEQAKTWVRPDERQLASSKEAMLLKNKEILDDLRKYYGPAAAEQAQPVLTQTVEDYLKAMRDAATTDQLDKQLEAISQQGDKQVKEIVEQYGDPLGITSEQDIAAMRADMIALYQPLEEKIETLYGRNAALDARKLFNNILENATKVARTDTRVSYKREEMARLNKDYLAAIAKLQARYNEQLAKRQEKALSPAVPNRK